VRRRLLRLEVYLTLCACIVVETTNRPRVCLMYCFAVSTPDRKTGAVEQLGLSRISTLCMQSAILLRQIRPSVCLSVTVWYCIETNAHIVKVFLPSVRRTTLVFRALPPLRNSKGNSLSGGVKYKEWGKTHRFSTEISVYLGNGTIQAHGYYGSLTGSHW